MPELDTNTRAEWSLALRMLHKTDDVLSVARRITDTGLRGEEVVELIREHAWRSIARVEAGQGSSLDSDDWDSIEVEARFQRAELTALQRPSSDFRWMAKVAGVPAVIASAAIAFGYIEELVWGTAIIGSAMVILYFVPVPATARRVRLRRHVVERATQAANGRPVL